MSQGNIIFEMEIDWGEVRSIAAAPFSFLEQRAEMHRRIKTLGLLKAGPMGTNQRHALDYIRRELTRRRHPFIVLAYKNKPETTAWASKDMVQEILRQGFGRVSAESGVSEARLRDWCISAVNGKERNAIKAALLRMTAVGGAP